MKLTVPNQLTILRILLIPFFLYFFTQQDVLAKLMGTILYFIAAATDWYDGFIARRLNVVTRWGQFMDPLADKLLISSALIAFAWIKFLQWWMVIAMNIPDLVYVFLSYTQTTNFFLINTAVAFEQFGYGFGFTA